MIDWFQETVSLLLSGANDFLTAALRLVIVGIGIYLLYLYLRELARRPVIVVRVTAAIFAALFIGFTAPLYVNKYVFELPGLLVGVVWIAGWVVAYYVAITIMPSASNKDET